MAGTGTWLKAQQNQPLKKKDRTLPTEIEYQIQLRGGTSEKQTISIAIAEAYAKAPSMKSFFNSLTQKGYALYERGGRIAGIQGEKRRYRFSTLGYSHERLTNLNLKTKEQKRSAELLLLRKKRKEHNKHKNR